jgi:DNA-binding NarL/FixJ family response regulator
MHVQLPQIRVLLVDDSVIVRERLTLLLSDLPHVEVVGEVDDAPQALELIRRRKPDVVILDIHLPHGSGLELLPDIKREFPAMTVIMLTNYPYPQYRAKCLANGADFFFDKSTEFQKIAGVMDRFVVHVDQVDNFEV